MSTGINVTKPIKILDEGVLLTSDVSQIDFTGGVTATTSGNNVTVNVPAAGITVGTTPVTSGTDGRVFFQAGGVVQQDAAFFWDNTNKRLGIGATPSTSVRLDVRAQGALSTDIAFRVRNSADTSNIVDVQGNGITTLTNPDAGGVGTSNLQLRVKDVLGNTASFGCGTAGTYIRPYLNFRVNLSSTDVMILNSTTGLITTDDSVGSRITYSTSNYRVAAALADVTIANNQVCLFSGTGVNIGRTSTTSPNGGTNVLEIRNGTIPSSNVTDTFQQYSADITAGNAAPHFRTENGAIVKVYQETTAVAAATLVGNAGTNITDTDTFDGYTLKQIVKALRNQGLLA